MDPSVVIWAFVSLLTNFIAGPSLDEEIRKLRGKVEYFSARIEDLETANMKPARGRKRKRNDDVSKCIARGRGLITEAQSLLCQLEEGSPEQKRQAREERGLCGLGMPENIFAVQKSCGMMAAHERKVDTLLRCSVRDGLADNGPSLGKHIPAKALYGQVASTTLSKLQALLLDTKVARMAILGAEGLGKTALMKHLHNYAFDVLKAVGRLAYVIWVTCPAQSSITMIQDAVAAAVGCDLSDIGDLILRARKLSNKLAGLGECVLFLDAVPDAVFSLEEIGVPVPTEVGFCKVVITTRSSLVCRSVDCSGIVQVNPLLEEEALGLFMHEAEIDLEHVYLLDGIPKLLANVCGGDPSVIVDTANRMRGIFDICEWRNRLFELKNHAVCDEFPMSVCKERFKDPKGTDEN